jgi:hypothetical protein
VKSLACRRCSHACARIAVLLDSCVCRWPGAVDTAESTLAGADSSVGARLQSCGRVDAPRKESKGDQRMLDEVMLPDMHVRIPAWYSINAAPCSCSQMEDRVVCLPNIPVNDRHCRSDGVTACHQPCRCLRCLQFLQPAHNKPNAAHQFTCTCSFYSVLDGHEGESAADYVAQHLPGAVVKHLASLARCGTAISCCVWLECCSYVSTAFAGCQQKACMS